MAGAGYGTKSGSVPAVKGSKLATPKEGARVEAAVPSPREQKLTALRQQRDERRAGRAARLSAADAGPPMPELTGTAKQVAWATKLRQNAIDVVRAKIAEGGEARRLFRPTLSRIAGVTDAEWWIDNGRRPVDAVYNAPYRNR